MSVRSVYRALARQLPRGVPTPKLVVGRAADFPKRRNMAWCEKTRSGCKIVVAPKLLPPFIGEVHLPAVPALPQSRPTRVCHHLFTAGRDSNNLEIGFLFGVRCTKSPEISLVSHAKEKAG